MCRLIIIILSSVLVAICDKNYLNLTITNFLISEAISITGIMLSINLLNISNMYIKLVEREEKVEKELLTKSKKELKENANLLIICFFILLATVGLLKEYNKNLILYFILMPINLSSFISSFYSMYYVLTRFILNYKPLIPKTN